jgi:outer membrane autotransporter protein
MDTLVFDGAGSAGFTPMAFENAIKEGAGTFIVANLPTMQRVEIKQGVLEVNNNYQFSDSGSFQTIVNGGGSFGQLKVNGTTELAGDLSVLKGPGHFKNGATYPIIEATDGPGVTGAFDNILLPATKPLLRFDVHQQPNAVEVEAHSRRFTSVATNRVERTIANYLDRVMPTAAGDLSNVLGEVQSSSLSQLGTAFSSLSSDSYDNYTRTTYESMWQYTGSLQRRLNNIRAYGIAEGYDPESKPLLLAFAGSDANLGQLLSPDQISQTQAKNGLWFNGYGQWGDQESDKGFTGFEYDLYGGTLGFDHTFGDKLIAGLSLGYSRAEVELDHHQGDGSIKTFTGSLYGSYFTKSAYVEGAVSYGRNWYDNHRLLTVGATPRRASSDHEGDLFSGYLGGGYTFDIRKWLIGPFGTLRYTYLDEESFEEKGAGAVSLRIDDRQTDALVSELGIRLARVFKTKCGSLIPEASAAWLHDFDIDDRVITSSFAGSPGASFSIEGQDVDRNGATLGAAITFVHKSGLSTSLKYRGEFREKYRSNGVMGELRFMF